MGLATALADKPPVAHRLAMVSTHLFSDWRLALNLDKATGLSFPSPLVGEGRRERSPSTKLRAVSLSNGERWVRGKRLTIGDFRLTIEMPLRQPNRKS
jgi:hypothetical protein